MGYPQGEPKGRGTALVRLHGIDCPEKGQKHGKEARRLAHRIAYGRVALIESRGEGRYGRTIGNVILPGGKNLNHELVKAGACWWYRRYAPKSETLKMLEGLFDVFGPSLGRPHIEKVFQHVINFTSGLESIHAFVYIR